MKYEECSAETRWKFYLGDTLEFYSGPTPDPGSEKYHQFKKEIKRLHHRYNVVRKIAISYKNALVGYPFSWQVMQGDKADKDSEAHQLLQQWWRWQRKTAIQQKLNKGNPIAAAIIQMLVRGTGYLRLYSPKRYQNLAPFQQIVLHCPEPGSICIERDDDGILYQAEYSFVANGKHKKERYTLQDDGLTLYQIEGEEDRTVNLGGFLPIIEISGEPIISPDVLDCQKAINKALTLTSKNLDFAYRTQYVLGGMPPGEFIEDPQAPGGFRFVPGSPISGGPGKVNFISGVPIGSPKNPSGHTNPSMVIVDPISIETFQGAFNLAIECAYRAADLGHLLAAADGSVNAVSRKTLKEDFLSGLADYETEVESAIASVFEIVLRALADSMNRPSLQDYMVNVQLKLNTGRPLPEERQENRNDYQAGLLSRRTAMIATGEVDDVDAEMAAQEEERQRDIEAGAREPSFLEQFGEDGEGDEGEA